MFQLSEGLEEARRSEKHLNQAPRATAISKKAPMFGMMSGMLTSSGANRCA